jgi:L-ascorbate metabolism protein UlaG (beta-lactamase superfamily)
MKSKLFIFYLMLFLASTANAQNNSDVIKTEKGDLTVRPITHGTLALMWDNKTILVDPYGGEALFSELPAADLILITDIHGDHMDKKTLAAIPTHKARMVVPQAVAEQLPEYKDQLLTMENGETMEVMGLSIEAIPMYNLPGEPNEKNHIKGRGNGYLLTIGGKRIYISGDTADTPEMRNLQNIDVAFVCMNLPYTMDIESAASAVLDFEPKIVYPFHYRGSDVEAFKEMVTDENQQIEVRLREWYP